MRPPYLPKKETGIKGARRLIDVKTIENPHQDFLKRPKKIACKHDMYKIIVCIEVRETCNLLKKTFSNLKFRLKVCSCL